MNELVKQTKNSERTNTLGRKNGVFYLFHLTEICEYYNTDVSKCMYCEDYSVSIL